MPENAWSREPRSPAPPSPPTRSGAGEVARTVNARSTPAAATPARTNTASRVMVGTSEHLLAGRDRRRLEQRQRQLLAARGEVVQVHRLGAGSGVEAVGGTL